MVDANTTMASSTGETDGPLEIKKSSVVENAPIADSSLIQEEETADEIQLVRFTILAFRNLDWVLTSD